MNFQEVMKRRRDMNEGIVWADEITAFREYSETARVYLGAGRDSQNIEKLKEHKVSKILNVADDVPNFFENSSKINIKYKNLFVGDFGTDKGISRVFKEAADFVQQVITEENEEALLIHCANGSNRSATIVISVLMSILNYPLSKAWNEVKQCHKQSLPLKDNRNELLKFEEQLFGSKSMKEENGTLVSI